MRETDHFSRPGESNVRLRPRRGPAGDEHRAGTVLQLLAAQRGVPPGATATLPEQLARHSLTAMQRTAGNRATVVAVQRLMTASQLTDLGGEAHADVKLGKLTLRKMSTRYKAVIAAVREYHDALLKMRIAPAQTERNQQATALKDFFLEPIESGARAYLQHQPEGRRVQAMQRLLADVARERNAIDVAARSKAAANPTPHKNGALPEGPPWGTVLAPLVGGFAKVERAMQDESIQDSLFHGTASPILDKMQGELLSGSELVKRGVKRETGEGDFFSTGGGGEKDFISVGQGAPGLGTAMAYAKAPTMFKDYNVALYSDAQLTEELREAKRAVESWDDALTPDKDGYVAEKKNKQQFEAMVKRLQGEVDARKKLPHNHPRRQGKDFSVGGYPLMFQFNSQGLNVTNPRGNISLEDHTVGPIALGGERQLKKGVDLRDPLRLEAVWCPLEHVQTVRARVARIVGHDRFDVIPLEVAEMLPKSDGNADIGAMPSFEKMSAASRWTETATLETMESMYDNSRRMILHAYGEAMSTGKKIDGPFLTQTAKRIGLQ